MYIVYTVCNSCIYLIKSGNNVGALFKLLEYKFFLYSRRFVLPVAVFLTCRRFVLPVAVFFICQPFLLLVAVF